MVPKPQCGRSGHLTSGPRLVRSRPRQEAHRRNESRRRRPSHGGRALLFIATIWLLALGPRENAPNSAHGWLRSRDPQRSAPDPGPRSGTGTARGRRPARRPVDASSESRPRSRRTSRPTESATVTATLTATARTPTWTGKDDQAANLGSRGHPKRAQRPVATPY
jgi:hypothetical protein